MKLVGALRECPLDIVGDVHGEIDVLKMLLSRLGYDPGGGHPDGRSLVFVGDLVDRGPDSPAVLRLVRDLVDNGQAQCVLGNHEINLLCNEPKHGNSWWTAPGAASQTPMAPLDNAERPGFASFLGRLPLVLEREDLRIVHACWHAKSIDALRESSAADQGVVALFRRHEARIEERLRKRGLFARARLEMEQYGGGLDDPMRRPAMMPARAEVDALRQMGNPLRVITSGEEAPADEVFYAGGKWRMVKRVKWWEAYDEPTAVVVGHYWRRFAATKSGAQDEFGPDLFAGIACNQWMGKRNNVYCVDFSIGARSAYLAAGRSSAHCRLAAVRVPEWEVLHDDGSKAKLESPAAAGDFSPAAGDQRRAR